MVTEYLLAGASTKTFGSRDSGMRAALSDRRYIANILEIAFASGISRPPVTALCAAGHRRRFGTSMPVRRVYADTVPQSRPLRFVGAATAASRSVVTLPRSRRPVSAINTRRFMGPVPAVSTPGEIVTRVPTSWNTTGWSG